MSDTFGSEVLVVDDSPAVVRALASVLNKEGFGCIACDCGLAALDHVARGGAVPPVAAVIDIHLPDINGLVLSQKLRERFGPDTPIIVVSGDNSTETIKTLSHVGATYFFSKPVSATMLIARLKELLANTGPA